jgi:hypothetical protein
VQRQNWPCWTHLVLQDKVEPKYAHSSCKDTKVSVANAASLEALDRLPLIPRNGGAVCGSAAKRAFAPARCKHKRQAAPAIIEGSSACLRFAKKKKGSVVQARHTDKELRLQRALRSLQRRVRAKTWVRVARHQHATSPGVGCAKYTQTSVVSISSRFTL